MGAFAKNSHHRITHWLTHSHTHEATTQITASSASTCASSMQPTRSFHVLPRGRHQGKPFPLRMDDGPAAWPVFLGEAVNEPQLDTLNLFLRQVLNPL